MWGEKEGYRDLGLSSRVPTSEAKLESPADGSVLMVNDIFGPRHRHYYLFEQGTAAFYRGQFTGSDVRACL